MNIVDVLPVSDPGTGLEAAQTSRIRFVDDPELGRVIVRWRYLIANDRSPRWRCNGCGTQSDSADACEHIFAAAIHLAADLLGLTAAGVRPADENLHSADPAQTERTSGD